MRDRLDAYLAGLARALLAVDLASVEAVVEALMDAWREERQVFVFGNGGSAALASHMACDLAKTVAVAGLPHLRAISLVDNIPQMTAWANDASYDRVFAEPLRGLCRPGDLAIAISCSGNSPNVLAAARQARELGLRVIAFTGDDGGRLRDLADVCVLAPIGHICQQEDVHLALEHAIASALKERLLAISARLQTRPRALILAAGQGTRMLPLTRSLPKPMLPVDGRPLLEHTVRWLHRHGVEDIAVNLHHCPATIVDHLRDGSALGVRIRYSHEQQMLGTAGALRPLAGFVDGGPLVVVYGDVLTDLDLGALLAFHHDRAVCDPATRASLSLYHVSNPTEVGLVGLNGGHRIERFLEKPAPHEVFGDLASAGVIVMEPSLMEFIAADGPSDFGRDVFPRALAAGGSLYGWVIPDGTYLVDIGTPEKYALAQHQWPLRSGRVA